MSYKFITFRFIQYPRPTVHQYGITLIIASKNKLFSEYREPYKIKKKKIIHKTINIIINFFFDLKLQFFLGLKFFKYLI